MALLGSVRFFQEYGAIRHWMKSSFKEPSYGWPSYSDFYITLTFAVISFVVNYILNKLTWSFFYSYCKEKNNEKLRIGKTVKACNSFYKSLYFMLVTIWGYTVIKDEKYLPRALLGSGDL